MESSERNYFELDQDFWSTDFEIRYRKTIDGQFLESNVQHNMWNKIAETDSFSHSQSQIVLEMSHSPKNLFKVLHLVERQFN